MLLKQTEDLTAPQLLEVYTGPDCLEGKSRMIAFFVEYRSRRYSLVAKILVHDNLEIDESTEAVEGRIFCDILEVIVSHFKSSLKAL